MKQLSMQFLPISYDEMDVLIIKELPYTQPSENIGNFGTVEVDNYYNLEREPIVIINPIGTINTLTIENTINNCKVTLNGQLLSSDVIKIKSCAAYKNDVEIAAEYNKPFVLQENNLNVLKFLIEPSDAKINISITWTKPSGVVRTQGFVENFSVSRSINGRRRTNRFLNKYSSGGYIVSDCDLNFSMNKLWLDTNLFDDDDVQYSIIYKTDSRVTNIRQCVVYLCGCTITNHIIEQRKNAENIESISGVATKRYVFGDLIVDDDTPNVYVYKEDKHYVANITTPSDVWVISHDLKKYPSVTIVDQSGKQREAEVIYNNISTITIYFAYPMVGKVILN